MAPTALFLDFTLSLYPSSHIDANPKTQDLLSTTTLEKASSLLDSLVSLLDSNSIASSASPPEEFNTLVDYAMRVLVVSKKTKNISLFESSPTFFTFLSTLLNTVPSSSLGLATSPQLTTTNLKVALELCMGSSPPLTPPSEPRINCFNIFSTLYNPNLQTLANILNTTWLPYVLPSTSNSLGYMLVRSASSNSNPKSVFTTLCSLLNVIGMLHAADADVGPLLGMLWSEAHKDGIKAALKIKLADDEASPESETPPSVPPTKKQKLSKSKESKQSSYHTVILASINDYLLNHLTTNPLFIPSILQSYSKSPTSSPSTSFSFFRMVTTTLTTNLLSSSSSSSPPPLPTFTCILSLLTHLSESHIYSPTSDSNDSQFAYLSSLTTFILSPPSALPYPPTSFTCLTTLANLNHRLLHTRLPSVLSFVSSDEILHPSSPERLSFLLDLTTIYGRLRDVPFFTENLLETPLQEYGGNKFKAHMTNVLATIPHGQSVPLLKVFESHLSSHEPTPSTTSLLSCYTFGGPIELHNSLAVQETCKSIMSSSVTPVLSNSSAAPSPQILEVTCMLEKINGRCNFYLADDFRTTTEPTLLHESIPTFLNDTVKLHLNSSSSAFSSPHVTPEFLITASRLCSYRLTMLTDEDSSSTQSERLTLTSFLFHVARTVDTDAAWEIIYSAAPMWKDTAATEDAKSFLKYTFSTLASPSIIDKELQISIISDLKIYEICLLSSAAGSTMEECLKECSLETSLEVENLCCLLLRLDRRFLSSSGGWSKILMALLGLDGKMSASGPGARVCLRKCIARALQMSKGEEEGPKPEDVLLQMWETIKPGATVSLELRSSTTEVISALPPTQSLFDSLSELFSKFSKPPTRKTRQKNAPTPLPPILISVIIAAVTNLRPNSVMSALPFISSVTQLIFSLGSSSSIISSELHCSLITTLVPFVPSLASPIREKMVAFVADLIPILLDSFSPSYYALLSNVMYNDAILSELPPVTLERITETLISVSPPAPSSLTMAFAAFINHQSSAFTHSAVCALSSSISDPQQTGWTTWYAVMVESAKGSEGRRVVATIAKTALNRSFTILLKNTSDANIAESALSLHRSIIGKQDLLLLNPRQISGLLAGTNQVMLAPNHPESLKVLSSSILAAINKHYSNVVYSCASTFTSTLRTLLVTCIDSDSTTLSKACTKIMESMVAGKDVYKKHAVGLLLDYVRHLVKGMSDEVKAALMDGVFSLLDSCTQHETEQLNSLLTWEEKAVFRNIFMQYERGKYQGEI